MDAFKKVKLLVLIIMDGWGLAPPGPGNPVSLAKTPNIDSYLHRFPHTQLSASGESVGLPKGVDGNSETGHLNLGAGRIVYQDLARINEAIKDGSFFSNKAFLDAINYAKKNHSNLHLMGLIGRGGVHSENNHLYNLLKICQQQNFSQVYLHLFTDGRDSPPSSVLGYVKEVEEKLKELEIGRIVSIIGRYWAMDRDNRWSRTERAYSALTEGKGETALSAEEAVKKAYQRRETDEFISPTVIINQDKKPLGLVKNKDAVIFFNFRIDRPIQLTKAFILKDFQRDVLKYAFKQNQETQEPVFKRTLFLDDLFFVTMTEYAENLPLSAIAYLPERINMPLARVLSEKDLRQLHLSETEKERFVTYYFDGYKENPYPNEEWLTIPSPKVTTYDLRPEMSARQITIKTIERIESRFYNFILVNFANPDMVGHTGSIPSTIKALEIVDMSVGLIAAKVLSVGGAAIITADHGNAEELISPQTKNKNTKHSNNPVPFIIVSRNHFYRLELSKGKLADVAPTVLKFLGVDQPAQMTGKSLI